MAKATKKTKKMQKQRMMKVSMQVNFELPYDDFFPGGEVGEQLLLDEPEIHALWKAATTKAKREQLALEQLTEDANNPVDTAVEWGLQPLDDWEVEVTEK